MISEDFLHYIWNYRLFNQKKLETVQGENLKIIHPGQHNSDGGPDFSDARIKIGNTSWAGNVEIHVKSSDWLRHNHHNDKAYNNIILHVVFHNDIEITRSDNTAIPVIDLSEYVDSLTILNYTNLMRSKNWIPCENQLNSINQITFSSWYSRLLVERFERKSEKVSETLKFYKNNWEQAFYLQLASNFGFKLNAVPFELLAKSLPLSIIAKHSNNLFQLEALFFGQAGMLENNKKDTYYQELKNEYHYLKQKFSLTPMDEYLWKFLRLNPAGFPSIRIAQFTSLIKNSNALFSKITEAKNIKKIEELFDTNCSEYWETHYIFGKGSPKMAKNLGKSAIENIIINTVVPILFLYGDFKNDEQIKERALYFLENLNAEKNSIVTKLKLLGFPARTAADSQALLEMRNNYCMNKKCLSCGIGIKLLGK
jgi:hypothetical protein